MSASSLVLDDVTHRYAGAERPALDGVSLELRAGELLALVGASGAGKTTTLRLVAGYERPDAGRVLLDGRDITDLPPERRGFGMVFQHYALFPHLSVEDNVAFGLEARGVGRAERRARARQALADAGLGGMGARAVSSLSGGEQQRVALARALVIGPRVLLLDEPLSNLDPTLRTALRDGLRATLRESHVTTLLVTHDQEDAFAVADRVALLRDGRLQQVGTPEALYDAPVSRAVAEFIGRGTLLPARADGDGVAVIVVGGVAQRVRAAGDVPSGPLLAVLRPEALALVSPDAADAWPGTIVARRFTGAATVYRVALAGGLAVDVETRDRTLGEGAAVGVRVAAQAVALVAE